MTHDLELADGTMVALADRTAGGSKNETRYGVLDDGCEVVVKIQRHHGRLRDEAAALRFLIDRGVRVPRVISSTTDAGGSEVLVLSREPGVRTRHPDGWFRFGRDLARLVPLAHADWPLARVGIAEFVADHRARLDVVAHLLSDAMRAEIGAAIDRVASTDCLVVTHGDPGSGNYLDVEDGDGGTLLDWETADVGPFGLDIGRATFIGLMDLGRSGIPHELVTALARGYRSALVFELDDELLRAWTVIGGLQFIHGRATTPLLPERTPQAAAATLAAYLGAPNGPEPAE